MQAAADLFDLLTNDQKVPSWSRNKATIKPEVGAEVSLFGEFDVLQDTIKHLL